MYRSCRLGIVDAPVLGPEKKSAVYPSFSLKTFRFDSILLFFGLKTNPCFQSKNIGYKSNAFFIGKVILYYQFQKYVNLIYFRTAGLCTFFEYVLDFRIDEIGLPF